MDYDMETIKFKTHRRTTVDEVMEVVERYRKRHEGWSAKHFYAWYRQDRPRNLSLKRRPLAYAKVVEVIKHPVLRGLHHRGSSGGHKKSTQLAVRCLKTFTPN
jgi:hypothetical protein